MLYAVSCAPGALWQDSGMFQYRVWNNDIEGGLGLALAHPLYFLILGFVKQIHLGEFAYRVNLFSAVCGAFTIANLFFLVRLWLGKVIPAVVTAVSLALCWTFWQHSVIAEVYTFYTAIFSVELVVLFTFIKTGRSVFLYLLGLFNGLSIAVHMWGVLPLACYFVLLAAYLIKKKINLPQIFVFFLAWLIGISPYLYLIIKHLIQTKDLSGTIASALWGTSWSGSVFNTSVTLRMVLENIAFILYSFCTPNFLLLFAGVWAIYKISKEKTFAIIVLALFLMFLVFAFRYKVPDRYAFFIPFYCLAAIFLGLGSYCLFTEYGSKSSKIIVLLFAFIPILIYWIVPVEAEKMKINIGTKRSIPYRNDYTYFLRPWQDGNHGPELFAQEALRNVEKDAVIFADGTTVYALWYQQQVKDVRKDVKIISDHGDYKSPLPLPTKETINELLSQNELYVVSPVEGYCPKFLLDSFNFEKKGALYKVIPRETGKP